MRLFASEVPDAHIALDVGGDFRIAEVGVGRRQGDESRARHFADEFEHPAVELRLHRACGVIRGTRRPEHAVLDRAHRLVRVQHGLVDRHEGNQFAHHDRHRRIGDIAGHFVHALRQPRHEAQLGDIARLRLMIAEQMRRRLAPLVARQFDIAIDEDVFPRHEHIVENDVAVGFIEPARQRIVGGAAGAGRTDAADKA